MSILMGALGGLGEGAAQWAQAGIKHDTDMQMENLRSENMANKAMQLAKFSSNLKTSEADQERSKRVDRVNAALGDTNTGIIGSIIKGKYASPVMGNTPLTEEQQAVLDQGLIQQSQDKSADAEQLVNDPMARIKAQIATGDSDPKVAADLESKAEIQSVKTDAYLKVQSAKSETYREVQAAKTDATNAKTQAQYETAMARMDSAISKAGSGNTDFERKISILRAGGATDADLRDYVMQRKQPSVEEIATGLMKADKMAGTAMAMKPEVAIEKAKKLRELTSSLRDIPTKESKDTKPAPRYKDGELLAGPGGHTYIVKNGVPVRQ